jgi:transmembrane sensor
VTTPPTLKLNRQVLQEAADWFVDFRVGDTDADARQRFDEWLRLSPQHIRAYWEIAKGYVELPELMSADTINVQELIAYAQAVDNVVPLRPTEVNPDLQPQPEVLVARGQAGSPPRAGGHFLSHHRRVAAAAMVGALAITSVLVWQEERHPLYATDVGERRSITLIDGSTVDLNARSKLRIEFTKAERRVELLEGQALFQVAKNKARPFIVQSGDATVRAVGTEFDVYRKDSGTTVTVLEGKVAVYSTAHELTTEPVDTRAPLGEPSNAGSPHALPSASTTDSASRSNSADASGSAAHASVALPGLSDPSGSAAIYLSAGEQVTVTPGTIATPQHADAAAVDAWVQRKLIFHGTKLSEVVEEFNRYNRTPLVIQDPTLRDMEISGVYSSKDPTSLLSFLRDQGIVTQERGGEVRLERR